MEQFEINDYQKFYEQLQNNSLCNDQVRLSIHEIITNFQNTASVTLQPSFKSNTIYALRKQYIILAEYILKNKLEEYRDFANMVLMNLNADLVHSDPAYSQVKRIIRYYKINPAMHCPYCGEKLSRSNQDKSLGRFTSNKCIFCGEKIKKGVITTVVSFGWLVIAINILNYWPAFVLPISKSSFLVLSGVVMVIILFVFSYFISPIKKRKNK